jgi:DNA-binding MarR family transcriptional regulator
MGNDFRHCTARFRGDEDDIADINGAVAEDDVSQDDVSQDELPFLMFRAAKAMVADVQAKKGHPDTSGMSVMHGMAMRYVEGRSDVTSVELASYLRVTKQSASEIVAMLEAAGLVRRRPHPADGRARVVELTEQGVEGLAESRVRWNTLVDEWQDEVGANDLAVVRRALETFLDAHPPES